MTEDHESSPDVRGWNVVVFVGRVVLIGLIAAGVLATRDGVTIGVASWLASMIVLGLLIE